MVVANLPPPNANPKMNAIIPVYVAVIGKLNDPIAQNLVFNSDEVTNAVD